ncbi:MAG: heavy-metal-associated domain-containing protein [Clostridiales bacterium]|jgi:copper chaperone CopZ|nr:heavy-metal-associated domain-containing protein [Clostridiales bacterium]
MKKTLTIDGMMNETSKNQVFSAISGVEGVTDVSVNLNEKKAFVNVSRDIPDGIFERAIMSAGYILKNIDSLV